MTTCSLNAFFIYSLVGEADFSQLILCFFPEAIWMKNLHLWNLTLYLTRLSYYLKIARGSIFTNFFELVLSLIPLFWERHKLTLHFGESESEELEETLYFLLRDFLTSIVSLIIELRRLKEVGFFVEDLKFYLLDLEEAECLKDLILISASRLKILSLLSRSIHCLRS